MEWRGPFQIVGRENAVIYNVSDLQNNESFRAHVNRLHLFFPGNLSPSQLLAESAREDEYYIETVKGHAYQNKELWFFVKWLGFPDYPESDPEAWVRLKDCRSSPAVLEYRRTHHLEGRRCCKV